MQKKIVTFCLLLHKGLYLQSELKVKRGSNALQCVGILFCYCRENLN